MSTPPPHPRALVPNTQPAPFPGPEPLKGTHVTLERLSLSHIFSLYDSIGRHAELWTYLPHGPFSSTGDFARHIGAKIDASAAAFYAILLNGGGGGGGGAQQQGTAAAAGHVCLFRADLPNRVIEVGHVLYGPSLQRTRAATEVLFLLGRLVFDALGYRRWEWKCDSRNGPSGRAARRYGFQYEGTFRQHMIVKGRNRDSEWYSMTDGEWEGEKRVFEMWLDEGNFDEKGGQKRRLEEIREGLLKARDGRSER